MKKKENKRDIKVITGKMKREDAITELLSECVELYKGKMKSNKWYRLVLFSICIIIIVACTFFFGCLIVSLINNDNTEGIQNVISLITVCGSFLSLVFGILQIITKYVFPENDEDFIAKVAEIAQNCREENNS